MLPALIPINTIYVVYDLHGRPAKTITGDGIACFPEKCHDGDLLLSANYIYKFHEKDPAFDYQSGWEASVNKIYKEEKSLRPLLSEINEFPVISLSYTFQNCKKLEAAPQIPATVKYMIYAFSNCRSLIETPEIPDGVERMDHAFSMCASLKKANAIGKSVRNMDCAFISCGKLTTAPVIPKSAQSIRHMFDGCTSLKGTLVCDANISRTSMANALIGTQIDNIEGNCYPDMKIRLLKTIKGEDL